MKDLVNSSLNNAGMMELVVLTDLKSVAPVRVGSSPTTRTKKLYI